MAQAEAETERARPGETAVYRSVLDADVVDGREGEREPRTLWDGFLHGLQRAGKDAPCLARRGKDGAYQWATWQETKNTIEALADALDRLGMVDKGGALGLLSLNCPEWTITEYALYLLRAYTLPMYDIGPGSLLQMLQESRPRTLVVSEALFPKFIQAIEGQSDLGLEHVVLLAGEDVVRTLAPQCQGRFAICTWSALVAKGSARSWPGPQPGDLASINYTSGSTGKPKGVPLTHANFAAVLAGLRRLSEADEYVPLGKRTTRNFPTWDGAVYLSYLPLTHVLERTFLSWMLYAGGSVGYYAQDPKGIFDDARALKPTIFIAVPRIMNTLQESFEKSTTRGMPEAGAMAPLLGGRVKYVLCGGAPLSAHVTTYLRRGLEAFLVEGYAMTETASGLALTLLSDVTRPAVQEEGPQGSRPGTVGPPLPGCEVKLVDVPDMGYRVTDTPPRGQLLVRGPNVFSGYHARQDATDDSFVSGWFQTGDIASIDAQGRLSIIDRLKSIFKLSQGEFVAPERVEQVFSGMNELRQLYLYGDPTRTHLVAIAVTNGEVDEEGLAQRLASFGKAAGLRGVEIPRRVRIWKDPMGFSPDNGLLTPSFKLKRHVARERFQREIDEMYRT